LHTDNPAGRLLNILEKAEKIKSHVVSRTAWAEIFEIENDDALLVSRLGKVMALPHEIITDINLHFSEQSGSYTHWSKQVNLAFTHHNLNTEWSKFIEHIDEHTINYLKMSVALLDTKENVKVVSNDDIKKIRNKIDKILQEIIGLDIDEEFKKNITKYLRKIIIAIDEYNITGIVPIMESVESTLGHVFIDEKYKDELMNDDYGLRIRKALGFVADIITVSLGLPQIVSPTLQLLITSD